MDERKLTRYEYFILGNTRPVRIAYDRNNLKIGAQTPDMETGALQWEHTLMSRIEQSWEVEEIDAATFDRLCREFPEMMRARLARLGRQQTKT